MRLALPFIVVAAGCGSTAEHRSPLLPSEFHLFASHYEADGSGAARRANDSGERWPIDMTSAGYQIGAGLTWSLSAPSSSKASLDMLSELRAMRHDMSVRDSRPTPVVVQQAKTPELPPWLAVLLTPRARTVDEDHHAEHHVPGDSDGETSWTRIASAVAVFATAVAAVLAHVRGNNADAEA